MTNQSNTLDFINNNATSGGQALALSSGVQGETDSAFAQQQKEADQYHLNLLTGLGGATGSVADQEQRAYMDKIRKFDTDVAAKAALTSAGIQNQLSASADWARAFQTSGQAFGSALGGNPQWWANPTTTSPQHF